VKFYLCQINNIAIYLFRQLYNVDKTIIYPIFLWDQLYNLYFLCTQLFNLYICEKSYLNYIFVVWFQLAYGPSIIIVSIFELEKLYLDFWFLLHNDRTCKYLRRINRQRLWTRRPRKKSRDCTCTFLCKLHLRTSTDRVGFITTSIAARCFLLIQVTTPT